MKHDWSTNEEMVRGRRGSSRIGKSQIMLSLGFIMIVMEKTLASFEHKNKIWFTFLNAHSAAYFGLLARTDKTWSRMTAVEVGKNTQVRDTYWR